MRSCTHQKLLQLRCEIPLLRESLKRMLQIYASAKETIQPSRWIKMALAKNKCNKWKLNSTPFNFSSTFFESAQRPTNVIHLQFPFSIFPFPSLYSFNQCFWTGSWKKNTHTQKCKNLSEETEKQKNTAAHRESILAGSDQPKHREMHACVCKCCTVINKWLCGTNIKHFKIQTTFVEI